MAPQQQQYVYSQQQYTQQPPPQQQYGQPYNPYQNPNQGFGYK